MKRSEMRRKSSKTAARDRQYLAAIGEWLEDRSCEGTALPGPCRGGLQVHHAKGRVGSLMLDQRYWRALCGAHHQFVTEHPPEARAAGLSFHRNAIEEGDGE